MASGVKHYIAVASGKGGVGKSMVAVNLAAALTAKGLKVGILDADIYGPSVPRMMGVAGQKPELADKKFVPVTAHGIQIMSIGFLVDEGAPVVWRGPMVQKALFQLIFDTAWDDLDVLIIDMPPGTGDVQLTISQKVPLSGAVVVSTPQDIALIDARKGIEMFGKVSVPVLGMIENMSVFLCPECGHESHIFGHGGAKEEAEKRGVPFLGGIPLTPEIRLQSDEGMPYVVKNPDTPESTVFADIAGKLIATLEEKYRRKLA